MMNLNAQLFGQYKLWLVVKLLLLESGQKPLQAKIVLQDLGRCSYSLHICIFRNLLDEFKISIPSETWSVAWVLTSRCLVPNEYLGWLQLLAWAWALWHLVTNFSLMIFSLVTQIADWEDCRTAMQSCRILMSIQNIALMRFQGTSLEIHAFWGQWSRILIIYFRN